MPPAFLKQKEKQMSVNISKAATAELLDIKARGVWTPQGVLDQARSPNSALNKYFEWNESKAALKYNLEIARSMISQIRIERPVMDRGVVKNIKVPVLLRDSKAKEKGNYKKIEAFVPRPRDVLDDILGNIASARGHLERALAIGLALGLGDEIRATIKQTTKLIDRVEKLKEKKAA